MNHPATENTPATLPVQTTDAHHVSYCVQRSTPEGSSFYYATLFVPASRRNAWLGSLTLVRDIQSIPAQVSDSSLAAIKLAWWKTEMEKAASGQASHPVTRCLGPDTAARIGIEPVARMVQAVSGSLQWPRHFSHPEWDASCRDWGGEAYLMAARSLGQPEGEADARIRDFGAAAMRLTQLLMLAPAIGQGWHPFPVELLQQAGVSAESLRRREDSPALQALIASLQAQTRASGELAWKSLDRATRLRLRPLRALWRMRVAEMQLAAAENYPLLRQRLRITPLKKLWLAWTSQALRR